MVVHVHADVVHEKTGNHGDDAEADAAIVHIGIRLGIGFLAGSNDSAVKGAVGAADAGQVSNGLGAGLCREDDHIGDEASDIDRRGIGVGRQRLELRQTCADELVFEVRHELRGKDVVVHGIAEGAADNAHGESQRRGRGDEVLRTDDHGDERCGHDNTADAKAGNGKHDIDGTHVVDARGGEGAAAGRHDSTRRKEQPAVAAAPLCENAQGADAADKHGDGKGQAAQADTDGVVAVDVVGLRGPEHEDREEVGAGHEGDQEREPHGAGARGRARGARVVVVDEAARHHGELGKAELPDGKGDEHHDSQNKRHDDVGAVPVVLVAAPEQAGNKQHGAADGQQAADGIDARQEVAAPRVQAEGVGARRRVVEDGQDQEAGKGVDGREHADVAPAGVGGNEVGPQHGGRKGQHGEDEHANVGAALARGSNLGGAGQSSQLVDAGADARDGHAGNEVVHAVGKGADELAGDDEGTAEQRHVAAAKEVGEGPHKGADGGRRQQVAGDEPDPAVDAANVVVDDGGDAAPEVDGDLGAGPEESHADEGHEAGAGHGLFWGCGSRGGRGWRRGLDVGGHGLEVDGVRMVDADDVVLDARVVFGAAADMLLLSRVSSVCFSDGWSDGRSDGRSVGFCCDVDEAVEAAAVIMVAVEAVGEADEWASSSVDGRRMASLFLMPGMM
ncbi:hypothetical protein F503_03689 [Ophiostoma piceae UAMH 11346]|uniref:Uncharacterized protein n=1 Tax=Ophiostoma piceae (strain UAMH 11346) TaxID=1262450 RepID=S3BV16_OPHP1|nr:hypothetical protein F503_03689 [Ophiostoma piceae UAMH 11346]